MRRQQFLKAIALLILMTLFLAPLTSALAQEGAATETFDDEALSGWERSEGAAVQAGVLQIQPGHFAVKFGDFAAGNLSVKFRQTAPGVIFIRYAMGEQGEYSLIFHEDMLVLERAQNSQPLALGEIPWSGASGEWQTIEIQYSSGSHQVSLDGEVVIQAVEEEPLQGGGVGFWVEGEAAVEFDDLTLTADSLAGGEQPPEQAPAAGVESTQPAAPAAPAARLSINDLVAELSTSQANPTQLTTFVVNLLLSVVMSYLLSRVYVHWGSSLSNRRRFAANFILISVTTTFIILVVRSSVALSLGLVGALSIVRFRAAIKEPEELAYLFFAISIGIGLGDNQRLITVIALVVAIFVLGLMRLFRGRQADFNLHVTVASHGPTKVELETIMDALKPHCTQLKLMRFDDTAQSLEGSFLAEFRNMAQLRAGKAALRNLSDALEITFLDNKGIW
ncbi:MAG: DUF4956 domain-containing protein [Anaerolineae bacterium]|nr:DUF4956 domain-containing protein [Anaerolineae bacterium]MBL6966279.1 DUF4956 domain-containing protein [Anaerolineales bacterium]